MNLKDMQTEHPCMMWRIVLFVIMNLKMGGNLGGENTAPNVGNELSGNGMADNGKAKSCAGVEAVLLDNV